MDNIRADGARLLHSNEAERRQGVWVSNNQGVRQKHALSAGDVTVIMKSYLYKENKKHSFKIKIYQIRNKNVVLKNNWFQWCCLRSHWT